MNLRSTKEHENIRYPSLWKREVRRDFSDEDLIIKSPLSPLYQRGGTSKSFPKRGIIPPFGKGRLGGI
jgi:hypothetical protein